MYPHNRPFIPKPNLAHDQLKSTRDKQKAFLLLPLPFYPTASVEISGRWGVGDGCVNLPHVAPDPHPKLLLRHRHIISLWLPIIRQCLLWCKAMGSPHDTRSVHIELADLQVHWLPAFLLDFLNLLLAEFVFNFNFGRGLKQEPTHERDWHNFQPCVSCGV